MATYPSDVALSMGFPLSLLKAADDSFKPPGANLEWQQLSAYYRDQSRAETKKFLTTNGLGFKNKDPVELGGLLRRVIDRIATIYARPPARWLVNENETRLKESNADHKQMLKVVKASKYDRVWRRAERRTALHRVSLLRWYPSDERKSVVGRVFEPHCVMRDPNPACGDLLDEDNAFALEMGGKNREIWWRDEQRSWRMVWTNQDGKLLPREQQPFGPEMLGGPAVVERRNREGQVVDRRTIAELGGIPSGIQWRAAYVSPYPELPAMILYDEDPGGEPWPGPRQSRLGWTQWTNSIANELLVMIALQAHSKRVYKRVDPDHRLPEEEAINQTLNIDKDEEIDYEQASPMIVDSLTVLDRFAEYWTISEDLPVHELSQSKAVIETGAALRVQMEPLFGRREEQIPMADENAAAGWSRFRSVHNVHAPAWGVPRLSTDYEMEVEIPELSVPTNETELGNEIARDLALGVISMIDVIMRKKRCTRQIAIRHYERVQIDREKYPPATKPEVEGQQPAEQQTELEGGQTNPPDNQPDEVRDGSDSVVQAIRSTA